jgi:hypothetical protein
MADTERGFPFLPPPAAAEEEEEEAFLRLMAAAEEDVEVGEFEFGLGFESWSRIRRLGSG